MATQEKTWLISDEELAQSQEEFIRDYIISSNTEIFQTPWCCGYWLYGVEHEPGRGWLAFEFDENEFDPDDENQHKTALKAWRRTGKIKMASPFLPEKYFSLDHQFGMKCFNNGVQKWGRAWLEDADLPRIDEVIQWTLLRELRYG